MFPGLGDFNPKQMAAMMKQLGIKTTEIDAAKVIVEKKDGSKVVVSEPAVTEIDFQGQRTLQVSGKFSEQAGGKSSEGGDSDVKIIVAQTGANEDDAKTALEESNGDIAQAILKLRRE